MFRVVSTKDILDRSARSNYNVSMQDEIIFADGKLITSRGSTVVHAISHMGKMETSSGSNSIHVHGNYSLSLRSCYMNRSKLNTGVDMTIGLLMDDLKAIPDRREFVMYEKVLAHT